ncbi:hypothetical protein KY290_011623 [Solanum tuberosum]|uniref:Uncharacterized protein n=1 Tax=Solanum tuberosum TaxID=4113 RepID=A0ABQ7W192_SOLTU|nr:hypothetical protein KY290_011623 [Solanum tuberosum]
MPDGGRWFMLLEYCCAGRLAAAAGRLLPAGVLLRWSTGGCCWLAATCWPAADRLVAGRCDDAGSGK